jgi:hypothetical protein
MLDLVPHPYAIEPITKGEAAAAIDDAPDEEPLA